MERKISLAELKEVDERGTALARIATLNVIDKDQDVLKPGLLGGEQIAPLLIAHDWSRLPVGKIRAFERDGQLLADVKINMDMPGGRALHSALKFDLATPPAKQQWSFAFQIPEGGAEHGMHEGRPVRFLKRLTLLEVSPVIVGASVNTATLSVKEDLAAQTAEVVTQFEKLRERAVTLAALELLARPAPGSVGYKVLSHAEIREHRNTAVALAGEACDALAIPMVAAVELFREARDGETPDFHHEREIAGCAGPGRKIYLRYDLRGRALAEVCGHEAYHVAHPAASEREAEDFGRRFAAKALADAPRAGARWTAEQLGYLGRVIRSGLPIPR